MPEYDAKEKCMITYKLFQKKNGKLYPLFVYANEEAEVGIWLKARIGPKKDETHVKSRLGVLSLRPGFHSTEVPYTSWIGQKMPDGNLYQRDNTVWCECEVRGEQVYPEHKYGFREIPNGWYYFNTNAKQIFPWIISEEIRIIREIDYDEVRELCEKSGVEAQKRVCDYKS